MSFVADLINGFAEGAQRIVAVGVAGVAGPKHINREVLGLPFNPDSRIESTADILGQTLAAPIEYTVERIIRK